MRRVAAALGAPTSTSKRMSPTPLVAVAQLTATDDRKENLRVCRDLAFQAKAAGAGLLCLPECFSFLGRSWRETVAVGQALEGSVISEMRVLAKELKLWLSLGGFPEAVSSAERGDAKVYNTHVILDDDGGIQARYRKIHLFDVDVPNGPVLQESRYTLPGDRVVVVDSPVGRLGLSTCYDLRFPEMYEALLRQGAEILLVPSAFTVPTGKAHWEVLLRARAIETQCYVVAAAQVGQHNEKRASYGHSMVVDPWGRVLSDAGGETSPILSVAEIDLTKLHEIRAKMPIKSHRRRDIFYGRFHGGESRSDKW